MRLFNCVIKTRHGFGIGVLDLTRKYSMKELERACDGVFFNNEFNAFKHLDSKGVVNKLAKYSEVYG